MTDKYVFVMRDHGQYICDECLLHGDDDLEPLENFVNGEWVADAPVIPGYYPVLYTLHGKQLESVEYARPAKNKKLGCVWEKVEMRKKIKQRWSLPYPFPKQGV